VSGGATPRARIALVLGAGGPTGGAFISAALEELETLTGFVPEESEAIISTSAGAFIAAAIGEDLHEGPRARIDALAALDNGERWRRHALDRPAAALRRRLGPVVGSIGRGRGQEPLYRVEPAPYHRGVVVVSVDLSDRTRSLHHLASATMPTDVVRASAAVPFVSSPVEIDGHLHCDGAVWSATNADLPEVASADIAIVICAMVPGDGGSPLGRMDRAALRVEVADRIRRGAPTIVIAPSADERTRRADPERFAEAARRAVARLTS